MKKGDRRQMETGTRVICFANNKGGSGKSTTCSNVGYGLTQLGRRVLLIDGDMQLNLSLSLFDEDTVLDLPRAAKTFTKGSAGRMTWRNTSCIRPMKGWI